MNGGGASSDKIGNAPIDKLGIAPADAAVHRRWPFWAKVIAYVLMMILASVSIWLIDRLAMQQMDNGITLPGAVATMPS